MFLNFVWFFFCFRLQVGLWVRWWKGKVLGTSFVGPIFRVLLLGTGGGSFKLWRGAFF